MKPILALVLLSLSCICFSQLYKWTDEKGRIHYSDQPKPEAIQKTPTYSSASNSHTRSQKAVKKSSAQYKLNVVAIRTLLKQSDFKALNNYLLNLDKQYKYKSISEETLITAYDAFNIKDPSYNNIFKQWIKSSPSIYQPYLAKGIYDYYMGWHLRGKKFREDTTENQLQKFYERLALAKDSIDTAFHFSKKSLPTFYYRMNIAVSLGEEQETETIKSNALKFDKSSYYIRSLYLKSLTPRWGGSAEKVQNFISNSSFKLNKIKKLNSLNGYLAREAGDLTAIDKDYLSSLTYYSKALESGDNHYILFGLGKNHYRLKNYHKASLHFNQAIKINPEKPDYYYWRGKTHLKLNNSTAAMDDYNTAYNLDPFDKKIKKKRNTLASSIRKEAYQIQVSHRADSVINKLTKAIKKEPKEPSLYHDRSREYYKKQQYDAALKDIKMAIQLNPDSYDYYMLIDHVLFKTKDLNQIIKYWKQYIHRHPKDTRAYNEITGTYSQKNDIESALKYSKISSDLGDSEGFYTYNRFKEIQDKIKHSQRE